MKRILLTFLLGLATGVSLVAQETEEFVVDFGLSPPPHSPGVPDTTALLKGDLFSVAIYLSSTFPFSGRILEMDDAGAFHLLYELPGPIFAAYPGGGTAYSYEDSWSLSPPQLQSLRNGDWYAQVSYPETIHLGQIRQVPEPSSLAMGAASLAVVAATRRRRS